MRATMDVTIRAEDVHGESDHQQAGRADVCGLKVAVLGPKPPPYRRPSRYREKEQREQCQHPGKFVPGGSWLQVLHDPVIDAKG